MTHKKLNRIIAIGVFLVTFSVYLLTLSSTVVFWDVGEFIAASKLMLSITLLVSKSESSISLS